MTYTTDQVIALAQEVGAEIFKNSDHYVVFSPEELTAFANELREHTLLEAADKFQKVSRYGFADTIDFLRRMAGVSDA